MRQPPRWRSRWWCHLSMSDNIWSSRGENPAENRSRTHPSKFFRSTPPPTHTHTPPTPHSPPHPHTPHPTPHCSPRALTSYMIKKIPQPLLQQTAYIVHESRILVFPQVVQKVRPGTASYTFPALAPQTCRGPDPYQSTQTEDFLLVSLTLRKFDKFRIVNNTIKLIYAKLETLSGIGIRRCNENYKFWIFWQILPLAWALCCRSAKMHSATWCSWSQVHACND